MVEERIVADSERAHKRRNSQGLLFMLELRYVFTCFSYCQR